MRYILLFEAADASKMIPAENDNDISIAGVLCLWLIWIRYLLVSGSFSTFIRNNFIESGSDEKSMRTVLIAFL